MTRWTSLSLQGWWLSETAGSNGYVAFAFQSLLFGGQSKPGPATLTIAAAQVVGDLVYYWLEQKYNKRVNRNQRRLLLRQWHGPALLVAFEGANCHVTSCGTLTKVALEHVRPASPMAPSLRVICRREERASRAAVPTPLGSQRSFVVRIPRAPQGEAGVVEAGRHSIVQGHQSKPPNSSLNHNHLLPAFVQ